MTTKPGSTDEVALVEGWETPNGRLSNCENAVAYAYNLATVASRERWKSRTA
jgi:hypothetical protein